MKVDLEVATRFLKQADHLLIVSHQNPDGDAISSTLAAAHICRQMGKSVTLVNDSPIPVSFSFLPGIEEIKRPDQVVERFRNVIALDCADHSRVGDAKQLYGEDVRILNLDHHPTNDRFGDANVVDEQAAATCEILFDWIESLPISWDISLATCVFTGISTDTGHFRYANTSADLLQKASKLIASGVQIQKVTDQLYGTTTVGHLRALQSALSTLTLSRDRDVAWMSLGYESSISDEDVEGIVNYARNIETVEVGILFREVSDRQYRVSLRSKKEVNVGEIAQSFGGGGHERAAGCTIKGELDEVKTKVLRQIIQE